MGAPRAMHLTVIYLSLLAIQVTGQARPAQHQQEQAEVRSDFPGVKLVSHPACEADIRRICSGDNKVALNDQTSNFDIMNCLLNQEEEEDSGVSAQCHHVLWQMRHNITRSSSVAQAVDTVCKDEKFPNCDGARRMPGHYVSCVLEYLDDIEDDGCADFLDNLAVMVFTDYRIIYKFAEDCEQDIGQLSCGRVEDDEEKPHSQGRTIECLSSNMDKLTDQCKLQVLRVAELQAEDYHMDRPLYFACREDRERFCAHVMAGKGRVYQCLVKHKMEEQMSKKCRKQITRRQKMTSADYKVSKRLRKACKQELADSGCIHAGGLPGSSEAASSVKLAFILLCVEDYHKQGKPVSGECLQETVDHRRALMEDHTLSPELVMVCAEDIHRLCSSQEQLKGGQVIHCLMSHANKAKTEESALISDTCQREVEELLKVVDVAEDWKVDPVLQEACGPVVREACPDTPANGDAVLTCLAENLDSDVMTRPCEKVLMQIQYFVSRNFKLDAQLYKKCHADAVRLCHASPNWWQHGDDQRPSNDPLVLPCLYRNAYHDFSPEAPPEDRISDECRSAVRRVMKYRSDQMDLHPDIEAECMTDLAKLCSERTLDKGQELVCLQKNFQMLEPKCKEVVRSVTQDEVQYVELTPVISRVCKRAIKHNCMHLVDAGGVVDCLIEHRNDPEVKNVPKCLAAVTHFQLISLEDYTFSYKFKQSCHQDIQRLCAKEAHDKAAVISCLSSTMLNDTLSGSKQRVSSQCRKQVQSQLMQREQNVQLDPRLVQHCGDDIHKHCREQSETQGQGLVLECLRDNMDQLKPECKRLLFRRQQQSMVLPKADYFLFNSCKAMILKYCNRPEDAGGQLLDCLKTVMSEPSFDPVCERAVSRRLIEQKRDFRLQPSLRAACRQELHQHCADLLVSLNAETSQEGKVTECLKNVYRRGQAGQRCGQEMDRLIQEAARDVRQDPRLYMDCREDIKKHCTGKEPHEQGECLRTHLEILNPLCAQRVARLIEDVNLDVHTDPQLSAACALDLQRHCSDVPPGNGAQLTCLSEIKEPSKPCLDVLQMRMKLMALAIKIEPPVLQSVDQLITSVRESPSRDYFVLLAFGIIVILFFAGLCCGRVTKRAKYIQKVK